MKLVGDLRLCSKNVNRLLTEWVREFVASREAIASKIETWKCTQVEKGYERGLCTSVLKGTGKVSQTKNVQIMEKVQKGGDQRWKTKSPKFKIWTIWDNAGVFLISKFSQIRSEGGLSSNCHLSQITKNPNYPRKRGQEIVDIFHVLWNFFWSLP